MALWVFRLSCLSCPARFSSGDAYSARAGKLSALAAHRSNQRTGEKNILAWQCPRTWNIDACSHAIVLWR
eukprot:7716097-Pyramimonas_sp.AAC.1